jgi:hypothetical protein
VVVEGVDELDGRKCGRSYWQQLLIVGLPPMSLSSKPALAGGISDWLPVPTGIYFEINGKKFYFGDYSADPTLAYPVASGRSKSMDEFGHMGMVKLQVG